MRNLILFSIVLFLVGCTITRISRTDGTHKFEASNTSIGWEREDLDLSLSKKVDEVQLGITIGKSGGSESFDRAITGLEETMKAIKEMRP